MNERTIVQIAEEVKNGTVTPGTQDDGAEIEQDTQLIGRITLQITDIKTPSGERGVLIRSW